MDPRSSEPGTRGSGPGLADRLGRCKTLAILAAVLLATVALAGCATDGGDGDGPPADGEPFAAQAGLSAAEAEAEDWSEDAELVGIITIESPDDEPPEDWPANLTFTPDPNVGDGLSGMWFYAFDDGSGNTTGVVVDADGETQREENTQEQQFDQPIGEWETESSEAAEVAKEDENYTSILEYEDAEVFIGLTSSQGEGGGPEGPMWFFYVESQEQEEEAFVMVDAETGERHDPFGGM